MASEHALHGRKTAMSWFDDIKVGGSRWNKTRLARNRRIDDRAEVAEQQDSMCTCPSCQGGYESRCYMCVDLDLDMDRECDPSLPAYRLEGETTIGTLERLP